MISVYRSLSRIASSQCKPTWSQPRILVLESSYSTSNRKIKNAEPTDFEALESSNWPKPTELLFQPKVANSVKLIGKVSSPVVFGHSSDGNFWAATTILQDTSFRIPLKFEGDLAHIAVSHLNTSSCIYVAGQLSADPPPIDLIKDKSEIQVLVNSINFVRGSSQTNEWKPDKNGTLQPLNPDSNVALNPWRSLLDNPKEWWDYRSLKLNGSVNPKFPDFKRKDGSHSVWLDRAPKGILSKLEGVEFDVKISGLKEAKQQKGEDSWKDLIENPKKWWDNRVNKKNVKAPDFKHKETGEGLWLDSSPAWVESKLPPLKSSEQNAACGGHIFVSY